MRDSDSFRKLRFYKGLSRSVSVLPDQCIIRPLRILKYRCINSLIVRTEYYRALCGLEKGMNWDTEFKPQSDESVGCYGIWVTELFTPSMASDFVRTLERRGWDRNDMRCGAYEGNSEVFKKVRAQGKSGSWWLLGTVVAEDIDAVLLSRSVRGKLPEFFSAVRVFACQYGGGTTIVTAFFELRGAASNALQKELTNRHEPQLISRKGRRAQFVPRREACRDAVKTVRNNLHNAARSWLAVQCPGFFSSHGNIHPTLDLLLFDKMDPRKAWSREDGELFEHLGLGNADCIKWLPEKYGCMELYEPLWKENGLACWSLFGKREQVLSFFRE